jgi:hypothetical protein
VDPDGLLPEGFRGTAKEWEAVPLNVLHSLKNHGNQTAKAEVARREETRQGRTQKRRRKQVQAAIRTWVESGTTRDWQYRWMDDILDSELESMEKVDFPGAKGYLARRRASGTTSEVTGSGHDDSQSLQPKHPNAEDATMASSHKKRRTDLVGPAGYQSQPGMIPDFRNVAFSGYQNDANPLSHHYPGTIPVHIAYPRPELQGSRSMERPQMMPPAQYRQPYQMDQSGSAYWQPPTNPYYAPSSITSGYQSGSVVSSGDSTRTPMRRPSEYPATSAASRSDMQTQTSRPNRSSGGHGRTEEASEVYDPQSESLYPFDDEQSLYTQSQFSECTDVTDLRVPDLEIFGGVNPDHGGRRQSEVSYGTSIADGDFGGSRSRQMSPPPTTISELSAETSLYNLEQDIEDEVEELQRRYGCSWHQA